MKNKKLVWIVVAIAIIGICGYFYNQKNEEFKLITNDEELAEFMQNMKEGDREAYIEWRDEQYAMDIYGGNTPEETLDLYIEALKAGDMELASKYFRLEDQERELSELEKIDQEKVNEYISFLELSPKNERYDDLTNSYEIDVSYEGRNVNVARLILNEQTNKWKMESIGN